VVVRRDVPAAPAGDESERLDRAGARSAVTARVVDLQAAAAPDGLRGREQHLARGGRRRRGLAEEADLITEALDPPREPLGEDTRDLRQRVPGIDSSSARDDEPDRDRGRLVVREHQRRQPRPRPEPVAAADAGLAVDRDADVVEGDRVAADRPLGHAQVGGCGTTVHHGAALQHLEEGEQP
jgi:hypothetical protein